MDFSLTTEQLAIQEMARDFAEKEMHPRAAQWDEHHEFPIDIFKKCAHLGMAGIYIKEDVGGSNLSRLDAALIIEALAAACPSTAAYLSIHNMASWIIDNYGSEALRQKYLPRMTQFQLFSSYCLTEPNAGSDAASLQTFAEDQGDHFVLNGTKAFISGGSQSDIYVCMVRTEKNCADYKGISCLLIEKDMPGVSFGAPEKKLGWHSQPTTMVFFENCRVPKENLLGQRGEGFKIALQALNGGRVNIAACSLGGAHTCLEKALAYCNQRQQFSHPIADFQHTQFTFADMATQLKAAQLMTYHAAQALDNKDANLIEYCAMAKKFATDAGFKIANQALQLHGGYGYLKEYEVERFVRDLRVHQILEGTNEIMQLIIFKQMKQLRKMQ